MSSLRPERPWEGPDADAQRERQVRGDRFLTGCITITLVLFGIFLLGLLMLLVGR